MSFCYSGNLSFGIWAWPTHFWAVLLLLVLYITEVLVNESDVSKYFPCILSLSSDYYGSEANRKVTTAIHDASVGNWYD